MSRAPEGPTGSRAAGPGFSEAKAYAMPFGKYAGRKLDEIAETDEGLRYLDWLAGEKWPKGPLRAALDAYLGDKTIAAEVERLVGR